MYCHDGCAQMARYLTNLGGSPGPVVKGGDSCSKGCVFESQRHLLDGHFSHLFVVKIIVCLRS